MFLKKFKNNIVYYYFLKILIIPIYSIFWTLVLNLYSFVVGVLYKIKTINIKPIKFENNSKKLVKDNEKFIEIANLINQNISEELIESEVRKIKSDEYKKNMKKKNEAMALNPYISNLFSKLDLNTRKQIIKFATSDLLVKTACNYLGVYPMLARIYVNLNIPVSENARSSQLWHRDDFGYKNLDLFLAINEINDDNGPLSVLKKKDPLKVFYRIKNEINSGLTGERGKILDKDFNYLASQNKDQIIKLEGKSGTGLWLDSIRNYHKGGHCKSNYRIILRINYMTSDSTFDLESLNEERKYWYEILDKKDKNSFFTKKLFKQRSKVISTFKIPQYLFKLYHILSIKK